MLPLVLMVPLALVGLDFMVPWQSATPVALAHSGLAPAALSSPRPMGEESIVYHDGSYTRDYHPYNSGGSDEDAGIAALMGTMVLTFLIASIGLCLPGLIFACQYKSKVVDQRQPLQSGGQGLGGGDFRTSPFSCFDDTPTCLHATFCGACRAGDTYQAAGAQQFWTVIGLFMLANIIGSVVALFVTKDPKEQRTISWGIAALVMGGIFHTCRRQLRTRLGGSNSAQSPFMDFLLWACCSCCAIAQEARELDAAMGVRVECCCNLQAAGGAAETRGMPGQPQVTGQPVGVYHAMPMEQ